MRVSRNFMLDEYGCKCGCKTELEDVSANLIYQMQKLRDQFSLPIKIASGYRCPAHNKKIGGAKNSQHMKGKAVDIDVSNLSSGARYRLIQLAFGFGVFKGIGIGSGKLHLDVRSGEPVFWFY